MSIDIYYSIPMDNFNYLMFETLTYHLMQLFRPVTPFLETDVAVLPKPLPNAAGVIVIKRAANILFYVS